MSAFISNLMGVSAYQLVNRFLCLTSDISDPCHCELCGHEKFCDDNSVWLQFNNFCFSLFVKVWQSRSTPKPSGPTIGTNHLLRPLETIQTLFDGFPFHLTWFAAIVNEHITELGQYCQPLIVSAVSILNFTQNNILLELCTKFPWVSHSHRGTFHSSLRNAGALPNYTGM